MSLVEEFFKQYCDTAYLVLLTINLGRPSFCFSERGEHEQLPYFSKVDRDYYGY